MYSKPPLRVDILQDGGFSFLATWIISGNGDLALDRSAPVEPGVYAFVKDGFALYVGVATSGLKRRMQSYSKPGPTQKTSQRLNAKLKAEIEVSQAISVYIAAPPDLIWNGLPVHGSAGLELGLIKAYALPWNLRSVA